MRLSLRFILPLAIVLAAIAYAVVPLVDQLTLRWFVRDLDIRSNLIASAIQDTVAESATSGPKAKMATLFNKVIQDERLFALGYCPAGQTHPITSRVYPSALTCAEIDRYAHGADRLMQSEQGPLHISVKAVESDGASLGQLVLVHDMSFVERRSEETQRYVFYFFIVLGTLVSLLTVVIAQLSWRGWVQGMRALLRGEGLLRPSERVTMPELRPFERDLRLLVHELETEFRPRDESQVTWTPESLRAILHEDLRGEDIIVVSNREPYIHVRGRERLEIQRPASGLVTALEPIMRACSGTWIAHGSGSGDRESVDTHDRVAVPPEHPSYSIRRLWLSAEQENGYYYGFANEGLWPLCHIAHVRPIFRSTDWHHYIEVNRKFAQAVVEEAKADNPIVLVQDYHLALLPRLVRDKLPDATIITFWHIPWPNPESFAICPWQAELLDGLLGSSILGFHTQFHCNNFLDSVDRTLEARVDRELFSVTYGGKTTAVKRYPISIEWPPEALARTDTTPACRGTIRRRHGLGAQHRIGVGVDRLDYTKGILERFLAIERLLELQPEWIGRFSFIQIAAPSRSSIGEYQEFEVKVRALASRINTRFARGSHPPIILKIEHHEPQEVYEYYKAADVCVVSSLHDGMNLVAKEFIAARDDELGVLVLSRFTGAARELPESLVVNPYDVDQCAMALHIALTMPEAEQRSRMRIMRGLIKEFNIYRWAGRMLLDGASVRKRGRVQAETTP